MATKKANTTKLIIIQKSGVASISYLLDTANNLSEIRTTLTSDGALNFMKPNDYFLNQGSKIPFSAEVYVTLNDVLNGENTLVIGTPEVTDPLDPQDGVEHYNDLSDAEKQSLFNNIEIFNGLTFSPEAGFEKSFKKLFTWKSNKFPNAITPRVLTEVKYTSAFSKVTHSLQETSTNSGSVSLNTPYGGSEAEFKHEQSKSTSSTEITEYITGKYLVRKVALQMDLSNYESTIEFNEAIGNALQSSTDNDFKTCIAVLKALNDYGYYVPKQFNVGGALFTSDSTTISEYSESETNIQEFGGSFKSEFNGIGGGASYNNAQGSTQTTTTSDKFQITSFSQVGGRAGTSNDFDEWAKTLDKAIYWGIATFDEMLPSIALLKNAQHMNRVIQLFDKFNSYPGVLEVQPHINLLEYATATQNIFNPWGV